jgi:hypothetical protein
MGLRWNNSVNIFQRELKRITINVIATVSHQQNYI